jgi:hypothetical protein
VRAAAKGVKMPSASFDRAADTALIAGARNYLLPYGAFYFSFAFKVF